MFIEEDILLQLNLAFKGEISQYFPQVRTEDIRYNFFPDLEHPYCETAGSRIHLYADSARWAIVFEKCGYQNRSTRAEIELIYIGNCIDYPVDEYPDRNYISNCNNITFIDGTEFGRIENQDGDDLETFEKIGTTIEKIKVRDKFIPFDSNYKHYEKAGISISEKDNPRGLISFGNFVRYLHETNPSLVSATEDEIHQHIPQYLPKLMVINDFHFTSFYDKSSLPSSQETYKLIAKVLVTGDTTYWKPVKEPNNHWRNWESGSM